ncbi:MAG: hypothetical protein KatS3mg065_0238 [Chloroflexota bacterium]|nr:MAG: hypothetical protein KatS3mg065_0238 [Chloroflexota bacterium]
MPHDVVAPTDGLVTEVAVEAGQPVEYGQELGSIETVGPRGDGARRPRQRLPPVTRLPPARPAPDIAGGS